MTRLPTLLLSGLILCASTGGSAPAMTAPVAALTQGVDATFVVPAWSGVHSVGTTAFLWLDPNRPEDLTAASNDQRELVVRVFYPADGPVGASTTPVVRPRHWATLRESQAIAGSVLRESNYTGVSWPIGDDPPVSAASAAYPVILFSHGGGGALERNIFLIGELASRGFIVAAINHSYHTDFVELPDGRIFRNVGFGLDSDPTNFSPHDHTVLAGVQELWATDQSFVADQLMMEQAGGGSVLVGHMDLARLAAAGFSLGGAASYAAASVDARIAAVVDMDGTIWRPETLADIGVPFLFILSGTDSQFPIFSRVQADGYAALFDGAITHLAFEDLALLWGWDFPGNTAFGTLASELAIRKSAEVTAVFLHKYLDGDPAPSLDDPSSVDPLIRVVRAP